jgi:hypothetical protein
VAHAVQVVIEDEIPALPVAPADAVPVLAHRPFDVDRPGVQVRIALPAGFRSEASIRILS